MEHEVSLHNECLDPPPAYRPNKASVLFFFFQMVQGRHCVRYIRQTDGLTLATVSFLG